jgi:hypothetical protein
MTTGLKLAAALALGTALATACSSDKTGTRDAALVGSGQHSFCDLTPACKQIAAACMPKDDGTPGPVHECHKTGMEYAIEADCQKDLANCVSTCTAAPGFGDNTDYEAECLDGGGTAETDASGGSATDAKILSFPTSPLSTFTSKSGALAIELRTAPDQPMHVGPGSQGQLRVTDATTGAPVDGLQIAVTPWMPVMGHKCSPVPVGVEAEGGGIYVLTPLLASMTGLCELQLKFSGARTDQAVSPTFDISQ